MFSPERPRWQAGPKGRGASLLCLSVLALFLAACTQRDAAAVSSESRLFVPFAAVPSEPPAFPTVTPTVEISFEGVYQDGPNNQVVVLHNAGTAPQVLGGWSFWLRGTDEPIYTFPGGIIPAYGGKVWITTSRESRLSALTLGYLPEDAGGRYIPGNEIILRDFEGRDVARFEVREIPPLSSR